MTTETSQAGLKTTLPAMYFTDPDFFKDELERFFCNQWLNTGRSQEIPAAGDYVLKDVAGESIIIVRGPDEKIRAFYNVCRHRGTRMCTKASGTFTGAIRCPYHAWTYGLDGRLLAAPQMHDLEGFSTANYPLKTIATEVWDGHIFINLSPSPTPFQEHLADLPAKFTAWGMADLKLARRVVYTVKANWKLIIQNYSECLHCPTIHPALQRLSHFLSGDNEPPRPTYLGGRSSFRPGVASMTKDGKLAAPYLPGLNDEQRQFVYYYAVMPNLLLSLHPDYMMTHTLWPRSVDETEVICELHFHPDAMAAPGFDPAPASEFWDLTNRQDWEVCELSQLGIASRAYSPGPYSKRESLPPGLDALISANAQNAQKINRGGRKGRGEFLTAENAESF